MLRKLRGLFALRAALLLDNGWIQNLDKATTVQLQNL